MKKLMVAVLLMGFAARAEAQDGSIHEAIHQVLRDEYGLYRPSNLATSATSGFLPISSCPGVPTGIPSSTADQLVWDSTHDVLYAFAGGAWNAVNPSAAVGTLTQVLGNGNTTGAHDIDVTNGQNLVFLGGGSVTTTGGGNLFIQPSASGTAVIAADITTLEDHLNNPFAQFTNPSSLYFKVNSIGSEPVVVQTGDGSTQFGFGGGAAYTSVNLTGSTLAFSGTPIIATTSNANLYLEPNGSGQVITTANVQLVGTNLNWQSGCSVKCNVDGNLTIENNAGTGFNLLQLGGTTSSFPAWKSIGTIMQARLADDSGDVAIQVDALAVDSFVTFTGKSKIYSGTDGNFQLANNADTTFNLLQLGGTTSSFPALGRSGTNLTASLADGSAYTNLIAAGVNTGGTNADLALSAGTGSIDVTASQLKVPATQTGTGTVTFVSTISPGTVGTILYVPIKLSDGSQAWVLAVK